jgi:hypothetical protein
VPLLVFDVPLVLFVAGALVVPFGLVVAAGFSSPPFLLSPLLSAPLAPLLSVLLAGFASAAAPSFLPLLLLRESVL